MLTSISIGYKGHFIGRKRFFAWAQRQARQSTGRVLPHVYFVIISNTEDTWRRLPRSMTLRSPLDNVAPSAAFTLFSSTARHIPRFGCSPASTAQNKPHASMQCLSNSGCSSQSAKSKFRRPDCGASGVGLPDKFASLLEKCARICRVIPKGKPVD